MKTRKRTVWLLAVIAGVAIGIVAPLFAGSAQREPSELVADSSKTPTDWQDREVPEPEMQPVKNGDELRWKSGLLVVPGGSGFEGDAGIQMLGSLRRDGGAGGPVTQLAVFDDPIALALDAGVNPFAMLAGSLKKNFQTVDGRVTVTGPVPKPNLLSHWSDPRCVMPSNAVDDKLVVSGGRLANAVVIAEPVGSFGKSEKMLRGMTRAQRLSFWGKSTTKEPELAITGCRFTPRVLVVMPDESVPISVADDATFWVDLRDQGEVLWSKQLQGRVAWTAPAIERVGTFTLGDGNHDWMKGLVISTWYPATVTDQKGYYWLNLRPGDYKLRVIHESFPELSRLIHVEGDATHDFSLSLETGDVASRQ